MNRFMKDMTIDRAKNPMAFRDSFQPGQDDDDDDDDDGDEGIIDRCKLLTLIYLYKANIPFLKLRKEVPGSTSISRVYEGRIVKRRVGRDPDERKALHLDHVSLLDGQDMIIPSIRSVVCNN